MNKGFTLIELLVVVLIIGILSAVALPQYTAAVEKARAAEVVSLMASAEKAADLYVMEYGYPSAGRVELVGKTASSARGNLTIDIEAALKCAEGADLCESKDFSYDVYCGTASCVWSARPKKASAGYAMSAYRPRRDKWTRSCSYSTKEGKVICESLKAQGWNSVSRE